MDNAVALLICVSFASATLLSQAAGLAELHASLLWAGETTDVESSPTDGNWEHVAILDTAFGLFASHLTKENAGNLLRLAFHDAGTWDGKKKTGGANGSIRFELDQDANNGLQLGVHVIEAIKKKLQKLDVDLSYADLIQIGGAAAVKLTGGPAIKLQLGRADVDHADPPGQLPSDQSNATTLKQLFAHNGYSPRDLVALSGSHTIGFSRKHKPEGSMTKDPYTFDNSYYTLLLDGGGTFASDRALDKDDETLAWVQKYADDEAAFHDDFAAAYEKMSLQGADFGGAVNLAAGRMSQN